MNESTMSAVVGTREDRLNRTLAILAGAAALAYLLLLPMRPYPGAVVVKTAMCVALAVLTWRARERWLAVALAFSAAGDAFLAIDGERLFVPGLASFLITHVLYTVLFVRGPRAPLSKPRIAALVLIPSFAALVFVRLWPQLGSLAAPVALYMIAIVTMALSSLRVPAWTAPLGAALFIVSDSLIAIDKFLWQADWIGPTIWITYALAQFAIVHGWLASHRAPGSDLAFRTTG